MQTEEIVKWVDAAITVREDSYVNEGIPHYTLDHHQVLTATKPKDAKDYDFSIAMWMIQYGNDVTDWLHQIEFEENKKICDNISKSIM